MPRNTLAICCFQPSLPGDNLRFPTKFKDVKLALVRNLNKPLKVNSNLDIQPKLTVFHLGNP